MMATDAIPSHSEPRRPCVRVHDLLRVSGASALAFDHEAPAWLRQALQHAPWVVVRRMRAREGLIAVGVRGAQRNERCAAWLDPRRIVRRMTPEAARSRLAGLPAERAALPAMHALALLQQAWEGQDGLCWGPGGSVGFELATGYPAATPTSDLDIVIRAERAMEPAQAQDLVRSLPLGAPARIDVLVETQVGGMALRECAQTAGAVLLRTSEGPRLSAVRGAVAHAQEVAL